MTNKLEKVYNPQNVESRLYKEWQEKGYFNAEVDGKKEPFCIVMPPPNVTGQLHLGHALDSTLQDILIRAKRMQGYSSLYLPGTDHAGIATQIKVEEMLRVEEGKTKYDLGREAFLERVWAWKNEYATGLWSSRRSSARPAIGGEPALRWTIYARVPCARFLSGYMRKA